LAPQKPRSPSSDAALSSARTTLAYTRIYSPIDGLVINRAVDPGKRWPPVSRRRCCS
jgi:HlyD family secretion protein